MDVHFSVERSATAALLLTDAGHPTDDDRAETAATLARDEARIPEQGCFL
jgi:hypothetical protein